MCALSVVALLAMFVGGLAVLRRQETQSRLKAERYEACRCVACGYDVRANRDRCPECGADLFDQGLDYWKGQLPPSG